MDWMHLVFFGAACAGICLAWGYRGQAEREREQITYLRKQLSQTPEPPPAGTRALATVGGPR